MEEVIANNFEYGSDKDVIVALPNNVDMVAKQRPGRISTTLYGHVVELANGWREMRSSIHLLDLSEQVWAPGHNGSGLDIVCVSLARSL